MSKGKKIAPLLESDAAISDARFPGESYEDYRKRRKNMQRIIKDRLHNSEGKKKPSLKEQLEKLSKNIKRVEPKVVAPAKQIQRQQKGD